MTHISYKNNFFESFWSENFQTMSEGTEKGHRKLIQVLTIQASVPIFFVFPPITLYGLYHLEFIDVTVAEYLVYTLFR